MDRSGDDGVEEVGLRGFEIHQAGENGEQVDELGGPVRVPRVVVEEVERGSLLSAGEETTETWLLNAAHMKAVPGRKSDVRDSE